MAATLNRLRLAKARLLVVEDNPQAMEILSQILLGFGVTQARKCGSASEALALSRGMDFDLILVDDEMPEMDGLSVARQVRLDPRGPNYTAPIVLMTGLPSTDKVCAARDAGINFVVGKPIVPSVLLSRIDWIARETRAFVTSDGYRGPDRRFHQVPLGPDQEERREEALRLMATPERDLGQAEIDNLFD